MASDLTLHDHAGAVSDVLFFSIGEGAIVIDDKGIISRVNKVAEEILGYTAKELIGKWYPEMVPAEDESGQPIPNMERPITQVFFSGQTVFKKIYYRTKQGGRVPVALTVSPVMLHNKPIGAIEVFRDITDELQLEHAKDEFISIASHQLRTPATVVKQYLGMILEGFVESEETRMEMLRIAYTHNNNQLDIINDLLRVAQLEANTMMASYQQTDVVHLLHNIISGQSPEFAKRSIKLIFKPKKKSVKVRIDPLHIQMVLENLINNANKYSNPESEVSIEISETPDSVVVSVADQGIGIAEEDIPKLFNKFSRIENNRSTASGTGLGLYWAKKLIELYDGQICVQSCPSKGSTFSVKLPRGKVS